MINAPANLRVTLIIPVYNEDDYLERFLAVIDNLELPVAKELVIVNDCSTDDSAAILKNFLFKSPVTVLTQPYNQGKGAAIRAGIQKAAGDTIGVQDADMETDTNDIAKLLIPLLHDKADIVYGSRFKKSSEQVHRTFHYLINRILTMLSNIFSVLSYRHGNLLQIFPRRRYQKYHT